MRSSPVLLLAATLGAAFPPSRPAPVPAASAVESALSALEARGTVPSAVLAGMRHHYDARGGRALWTQGDAWSPAAMQLQAVLADAAREGLDPASYRVPVLARGADSLTRAAADVALSVSVLAYAHDVGWGTVVPGEVHRGNHYAARRFDADSLLAALAAAPDAGEALRRAAPQAPVYRALHRALGALDSIIARGGWQRPTPGPSLLPGARGPRVAELRRLLAERGDLAADAAAGDSFDLALASAVVRFRGRHGLEPDTVVDARMLEELAVPATARRAQVVLGMERVRWLPPVTRGRWITVNLADFHATLYEDGRVRWRSRTVIGKAHHETPMFADTMELVVINPSWNVPPSIARNEIGPRLRRDPGYLARNHMVRTADGFRQRPGAWNALGGFKFLFPNEFSVYMHDTPSRAAFLKADRAFSHGCVRLQDPAGLARVLLGAQGWTPERIDALRAEGTERAVRLETPVPVRITYATAFAAEDGALHYRRDVYGRDARLAQALAARDRHRWSGLRDAE